MQRGILLDITAQKEAELALRRSEAHFRSLVAGATDLTLVLDERLTVRWTSDVKLSDLLQALQFP